MIITDKLAGETARDYALRILTDNIRSLGLEPGTAISENELAMELGLSRTPVREAIIELSKIQIIETYPQRGNFVALIDPDLVEETRFLRRILDIAVIEEACDLADEEDLAEMSENIELQEFYLGKQMADKIYPLDNAFHKLIYRAAAKELIFNMRSTVMLHFDRVRTLSVEAVKDMKIVKDHREMYEAIRNKDKEWGAELVVKHMNRYNVDQQLIRDQYPQYFK
ncbi:MAG: GntR family transcriptional regulator [Lachnospiraceae bacterium]|nr:GntR family transcriptional regulator [Lachnospiraceae bacterium]